MKCAFGINRISEIIERNCKMAEQIGSRINKSEHFALLAEVNIKLQYS